MLFTWKADICYDIKEQEVCYTVNTSNHAIADI